MRKTVYPVDADDDKIVGPGGLHIPYPKRSTVDDGTITFPSFNRALCDRLLTEGIEALARRGGTPTVSSQPLVALAALSDVRIIRLLAMCIAAGGAAAVAAVCPTLAPWAGLLGKVVWNEPPHNYMGILYSSLAPHDVARALFAFVCTPPHAVDHIGREFGPARTHRRGPDGRRGSAATVSRLDPG